MNQNEDNMQIRESEDEIEIDLMGLLYTTLQLFSSSLQPKKNK